MTWSICACCATCAPGSAAALQDVAAGAPVQLEVTVYRAPGRERGSLQLDQLAGFALISETRIVHLPPGESRLRFGGVADGIEAQSAIVTGLPEGVVEKNRDAQVLSPSALLAAAAGKSVELLRTDRKTGATERLPGTILADADGGVVFSTAGGVEALRCSGLPETFSFEQSGAPQSLPSLSVRVRSSVEVTRKVTLSYLSRGFDWAADYTATLSADERSMDLGAWVTLANSNGTDFPSAGMHVVAGRVNRELDALQPVDPGGPILALCWPRGSTSDAPPRVLREAHEPARKKSQIDLLMAAAAPAQVTVTASRNVALEQLGDLKLYRLPERTTLASRQSKQVRLFDRSAIPVRDIYRADLRADAPAAFAAERLLRTLNDKADRLGLPLPSGRVSVFSIHDGERLLRHESSMRDLAVHEEVEIGLGRSPDVQVTLTEDSTPHAAARAKWERVLISNARPRPIRIELHVALGDGARVVHADHRLGAQNGRPTFVLTVPARGSAVLRYEIQDPAPPVVR